LRPSGSFGRTPTGRRHARAGGHSPNADRQNLFRQSEAPLSAELKQLPHCFPTLSQYGEREGEGESNRENQMKTERARLIRQRTTTRLIFAAIVAIGLTLPALTTAQSLQIANMAVPAKSFQMVIYPVAQRKGYMREEGLDERVIFVAPTTSIQAMLGGDVQFTGAGSSALVSMTRGNTPLKVVVATNDRVLQWLVTRPEITS